MSEICSLIIWHQERWTVGFSVQDWTRWWIHVGVWGWTVICLNSWFEQQAQNESLKSFTAFSKMLKMEKAKNFLLHFSHELMSGEGSGGSVKMRVSSHCWGSLEQKAIMVLLTLRWRVVLRRCGKKMSSSFPPPLFYKEVSTDLKKTSVQGFRWKKPKNEV